MDEVNVTKAQAAASPYVLKLKFAGRESVIEWPVERDTGKARLVVTPGKAVWIPNFRSYEFSALELGYSPEADPAIDLNVQKYIQRLVSLSESSKVGNADGYVEVRLKGKGKTDKSASYEFPVSWLEPDEMNREPTILGKHRRFTLARSLVLEVNGKLYYPIWALNQRLKRDKEGARSRQYVRPTLWPWTAAVIEQLTQSAEALVKRTRDEVAAEQERRQVRMQKEAERDQQLADQRARDDHLLATVGLLALTYCRRKFTLAEMSKGGCDLGSRWPTQAIGRNGLRLIAFAQDQPDFVEWMEKNPSPNLPAERSSTTTAKPPKARKPDQIWEQASVSWMDWKRSGGRISGTPREATNARVEKFGAKYLIYMPDGRTLEKRESGYLNIVEMPKVAETA
jgi:hypothetical protein